MILVCSEVDVIANPEIYIVLDTLQRASDAIR